MLLKNENNALPLGAKNKKIALIGPLGAGKTHLSRAIAEGLGIANSAAARTGAPGSSSGTRRVPRPIG